MTVLFMRRLLTMTAAFLSPQCVPAQTSPPSASRPDFSAIDRHIDALLRADRVPGASVVIVRGGDIVHVRNVGVDARGQPISSRTAFVLGSMSKSFTALAVMQLVEQGRIALDAPVQRYLPGFRLDAPDGGASITVRQLLLHTSGIPHNASSGGAVAVLGDHVEALRTVKPRDAAARRHAYASPNYLVLGAIVEAVSGRSFAEYVQREIFDPLQMRNSFTDRREAERRSFAGGHVYVVGFPVAASLPADPSRLPTAALVSSAEDLAHFLSMQLQQGRFEGRRLLADSLVDLMHTGAAPSEGFSYAFGWRDGTIGGVRAVHHGGIVPDFRGKMVMLPDSQWGVVVLTNVSSAIPWPLAPTSHRLADEIAASLAGRPLPTPSSRHAGIFAVVTAGMLTLLLLQLRTVIRTVTAGRRASPRAPREAPRAIGGRMLVDLLVLVAIAMLPRTIGLRWPELLRGAPDVGWWLVAMMALGIAGLVSLARQRQQTRSRRHADARP